MEGRVPTEQKPNEDIPVQVILPDDHIEAVVGGLRSFIVNTCGTINLLSEMWQNTKCLLLIPAHEHLKKMF